MDYEEYLNLSLDDVHQYKEIIGYKLNHDIPMSDIEKDVYRHMKRFIQQVRLESCFMLDSYEK